MSVRLMDTGVPVVEAPAPNTALPQRLGRYTLLGPLGEGAMGVVYRAHDPLLDRSVALKTFRHATAGAATRLRHEAQAAARLAHPGIVAVYEYGEDAGRSFIAMECVHGRPLLGALTARALLPIDDVLCLMVQLLAALQSAHGQGVWHRDIKPANLMVTREGRLKITDFGVARIDEARQHERGVVGSPGYLAPECYQRDAVTDQRADVYACGVLLFELLTGARPFRGSAEVVKFQTLHLPVPPLAQPGDAQFVPLARFAHVVQRALAKRPDERYASATEMREALTLAAARPVPQALSAPALRLLLGTSPEANPPSVPAPVPRCSLPPGGVVLPVLDQVVSVALLPPSLLRDARRVTAQQIGPLAALLVKRAAAQAHTPQQFIARLSELAAEGREREALYAALRPLCA